MKNKNFLRALFLIGNIGLLIFCMRSGYSFYQQKNLFRQQEKALANCPHNLAYLKSQYSDSFLELKKAQSQRKELLETLEQAKPLERLFTASTNELLLFLNSSFESWRNYLTSSGVEMRSKACSLHLPEKGESLLRLEQRCTLLNILMDMLFLSPSEKISLQCASIQFPQKESDGLNFAELKLELAANSQVFQNCLNFLVGLSWPLFLQKVEIEPLQISENSAYPNKICLSFCYLYVKNT